MSNGCAWRSRRLCATPALTDAQPSALSLRRIASDAVEAAIANTDWARSATTLPCRRIVVPWRVVKMVYKDGILGDHVMRQSGTAKKTDAESSFCWGLARITESRVRFC